AGTLSEIKVEAGSTVQINTVVAVIGGGAGKARAPAAVAPASSATAAAPALAAPAAQPAAAAVHGERLRSSPLVRKIAKEHQLDLRQVTGTGSSGRITKDDVLQYIDKSGAKVVAPAAAAPSPAAPPPAPKPAGAPAPVAGPQPGELVPLTRMRSIIAQRMVDSKRT